VRDEIIESVGSWFDHLINRQLIPALCRLNFGNDEECPRLQSSLRESKDPLQRAQRDQILLQSGVDLPLSWLYRSHDIPEPAPGEAVIKGAVSVAHAAPVDPPAEDPKADPAQAKRAP
jgi:phage gp29-like protein